MILINLIVQISLIGHNVLDLIHPLDQDELYHQLSDSVKKPNDLVNLYLRTKCIQQSKGRHMQLKSATYRVNIINGLNLSAYLIATAIMPGSKL